MLENFASLKWEIKLQADWLWEKFWIEFSVLHISIYLITKSMWLGWGGWWLTERYICGGGVQFRLSFFLSIVLHASTQRRTPAPRGMASQHLRTSERVPVKTELLTCTVSVFKKILIGTVLVNNLFLKFYEVDILFKFYFNNLVQQSSINSQNVASFPCFYQHGFKMKML